jgi:hypothetical protein
MHIIAYCHACTRTGRRRKLFPPSGVPAFHWRQPSLANSGEVLVSSFFPSASRWSYAKSCHWCISNTTQNSAVLWFRQMGMFSIYAQNQPPIVMRSNQMSLLVYVQDVSQPLRVPFSSNPRAGQYPMNIMSVCPSGKSSIKQTSCLRGFGLPWRYTSHNEALFHNESILPTVRSRSCCFGRSHSHYGTGHDLCWISGVDLYRCYTSDSAISFKRQQCL